jgi:hypothetical protein
VFSKFILTINAAGNCSQLTQKNGGRFDRVNAITPLSGADSSVVVERVFPGYDEPGLESYVVSGKSIPHEALLVTEYIEVAGRQKDTRAGKIL